MMSTPDVTLESLLRLVASTSPAAWYPKAYAQSSGVPREQLDGPLNDLRLAGLLKMTEWVKDIGQGYLLTPFGKEVLDNPQFLARLREGLRPTLTVEEERPEAERPDSSAPTTFERGEVVRNALLYPQPPRVTWVLIGLNVLVFLIGILWSNQGGVQGGLFLEGRDGKTIREMGALTAFDLINGDWWRVLMCCFLHFGIFHIAMNMYALFATGNKLESLWGRWRYLTLYLLSGIGGATIAVLYDPTKLLAGASGAVWGLMMSPVVWVYLNRQFIPAPTMKEWFSQWWMIVLCNVIISFLPNISMAAHFGGGAVGIVVSLLLYYQRNGSQTLRQVTTASLLLIPFICYGALHSAIENDPRWARIGKNVQAEQNRVAMQDYRRQVKPQMVELGNQVEKVDSEATSLIQRTPDKRGAKEIDDTKTRLSELKQQFDPLVKLHPENGPEATEEISKSAREYLSATEKLLDRLISLLNEPIPEGEAEKELRQLRSEAKKAKETWEGLAR